MVWCVLAAAVRSLKMSEILTWSAVETVARLRAKTVSAAEVCVAHLARLEAVDPALNAIADRVPDAMARAEAIDQGEMVPGLMHGAPINTDQEGLVNTNGLPIQADNVAPGHSAAIGNLMEAGAVVVGPTNTPEISLRWCTSNPLHGVTRNPWDMSITVNTKIGLSKMNTRSMVTYLMEICLPWL